MRVHEFVEGAFEGKRDNNNSTESPQCTTWLQTFVDRLFEDSLRHFFMCNSGS